MTLAARVHEARARVTVIIPTYNRPRFLEEALRSVLSQTRPVHQILLVDDGSAAENARAAQRLAGMSDRIEFHRLAAHRGAAAARNRGLDLASGDYVLFLDDDDLLDRRMIERSLAVLEADPSLDAVVCDSMLLCMPDSAPTFRIRRFPPGSIERQPFSTILRRGFPINSCLVRRGSIGPLRFPEDLTHGEDQYFWFALCRQGRRFAARPEADALVRRHGLNTTRSRKLARRAVRALHRKLLAERMADRREDHVVILLKLAYCECMCGSVAALLHLARAFRHPLLSLREIVSFGSRASADPRGFVRHYLLP